MDNKFPLFLTAAAVLAFGATWVLMDSPSTEKAAPALSPGQAAIDATKPFESCAEARAAGKAPLMAGRPGYNRDLDPDNIGVACP